MHRFRLLQLYVLIITALVGMAVGAISISRTRADPEINAPPAPTRVVAPASHNCSVSLAFPSPPYSGESAG
jgi:hypothetical protein